MIVRGKNRRISAPLQPFSTNIPSWIKFLLMLSWKISATAPKSHLMITTPLLRHSNSSIYSPAPLYPFGSLRLLGWELLWVWIFSSEQPAGKSSWIVANWRARRLKSRWVPFEGFRGLIKIIYCRFRISSFSFQDFYPTFWRRNEQCFRTFRAEGI